MKKLLTLGLLVLGMGFVNTVYAGVACVKACEAVRTRLGKSVENCEIDCNACIGLKKKGPSLHACVRRERKNREQQSTQMPKQSTLTPAQQKNKLKQCASNKSHFKVRVTQRDLKSVKFSSNPTLARVLSAALNLSEEKVEEIVGYNSITTITVEKNPDMGEWTPEYPRTKDETATRKLGDRSDWEGLKSITFGNCTVDILPFPFNKLP